MRVHREIERDIANESSVYGLGEQVDSSSTLGNTGRISLLEESFSYSVLDTEKCLQDIPAVTMRGHWPSHTVGGSSGIC